MQDERVPPGPFEPDYAVHPGESVLESLVHLACDTKDCPREDDLIEIIKGRRGIDEEIAEWLDRLGVGKKQFWLNLQANYEKDKARLEGLASQPSEKEKTRIRLLGVRGSDILIKECSACGNTVVAGMVSQLRWVKEESKAVTVYPCSCGKFVVWAFDFYYL